MVKVLCTDLVKDKKNKIKRPKNMEPTRHGKRAYELSMQRLRGRDKTATHDGNAG
jgi:hypothetical protein